MKIKKSDRQLLPASNPAEDQETISRYKLSLLFHPSLFEIRAELQRDKGIDLIVELKQDNSYTNFRFAVQLKSTANAKFNRDLTVSYPVDVANINYLLNYGMPTYYMLYDHKTDVFYVEHAHSIFQALIKKYPSQNFPKQFKARFAKKLIPEQVKDIYQQTLENGLLLRQLNTHLGLSADKTTQSSGIVIDREREVYSVEQNIDLLDRFGLLMLNRGEFKLIIELEQRTLPRIETSPMFNLVCGVAYFAHSNLFKAIDFLKAAHKASSSFDPYVSSMLEYTYLHARHLLGIISETDFKQGISQLIQSEQLGSYLELEKANAIFIEGYEPYKIRIKTLQNRITSLISSEPYNTNLRIRAYSLILNMEAKQLIRRLPLNFVLVCGRVQDLLATKTYHQWKHYDEIHTKRLQSLLKYCLDTHNFLAASNIAMDISEWSYQKLFIFFTLKNWDTRSLAVTGALTIEELDALAKEVEQIDNVIQGYGMLDHQENIVHALSFKYELLSFAGRCIDAESVANQITSLIDSHDMNALKHNYQSLLNGESRYRKFITFFTEHMSVIFRVAKNNGLEKYILQPISSKYLKHADFGEEEQEWMESDFFEMQYPITNILAKS